MLDERRRKPVLGTDNGLEDLLQLKGRCSKHGADGGELDVALMKCLHDE